ncbi:aminopeptidase P family protein [Bartonella sp. M0280]|nr:aminopeptidase P family protein [Bartonella apihabitans]
MLLRPQPIADKERLTRIRRLRERMAAKNVDAVFLGATSNLRYFTGLEWGMSERLCGVLISHDKLTYIVPAFEHSRLEELPHLSGDIVVWQEDESPFDKITRLLHPKGILAVDEAIPTNFFLALVSLIGQSRLTGANQFTTTLRMEKSENEIALIQYAMDVTLEVQKRVRDFLRPGISSYEVIKFIDEAHRKLCGNGSSFSIVSFGKATSIPHGVESEQILQKQDPVLIDIGTTVEGYNSDITRTYMIGDVADDFAKKWDIEKQLQNIVFDACKIGGRAADVDNAGRKALEMFDLGPNYRLPGIPHRIGHGLGLDIHEEPYVSRHDNTILKPGMCFSDEPTLIFPGKLGIRLEDAIYMTNDGPKWFTQPALSPVAV